MKINQELLIAATEVRRIIPLNFQPEDGKFFNHELMRVEPDVFLNRYNNVYITDEGMIFKNFRLEERNIAGPHKEFKDGILYYLSILLPTLFKKTKIVLDPAETYLHVYDDWSRGYFHWLCDVLPRLSIVERVHKNCILLLPPYARDSYFKDTISAWKFKDVFYMPENSYVEVKNLMCPDKVARTGNYNPGVMMQLREKFVPGTGNSHPTRKLYSSRSHAKAKFITNETEMVALMQKYGYESICFEDYGIYENAKLLSDCRSLVSMHGANLANMIFMPEGSSVMEFRKKDDAKNNAYFSLASALGINYFYQKCDFKIGHYDHPNRFDLTVDLEELEKYLSSYNSLL